MRFVTSRPGFVCHYLSIVFLPALNRNKEGVFLNDQRFFLILTMEILVFYCTDLVDSVVQCLCHGLLGCFLGQAFVAVLGSVGVMSTTDRPDHPDLKP